MATLENVQGGSFVPNIAAAFDKTVAGFEKLEEKQKAAAKLEDIQTEIDTITRAGEDPKEIQRARVRLSAIAPDVSQAVNATIKSGDARALARVKQEAERGLRTAVAVKRQKTFDDKKEAFRQGMQEKINAEGDPTEDFRILNLPEDEFNLKMDQMEIAGTDIATLTKERFEPTGRGTQRSLQTGKEEALPGAITPQSRAQLAQNTITVDDRGQKKVLAFNPETNRHDIPVAATFTKPNTFTFENNGRKITQEIDPATGETKTIGDSPVVGPQTDLGKIESDVKNGLITQAQGDRAKKILDATPLGLKGDMGELLDAEHTAITLFGEDSEQVKRIRAAQKDAQKPDVKLTDIAGMRKEFTKLSGKFLEIRDAMGRIEAAGIDPSPAGDLSLIFNFMKVQDPSSVVRESEFETAQNAASLPGRLGAGVQRALNGQRMLPEQRADFIETARRLKDAQEKQQVANEKSFTALAESIGADPKDVVIDFRQVKPERAETPVPPPNQPDGTRATGEQTPEGFNIFVRPDGSTFAVKP